VTLKALVKPLPPADPRAQEIATHKALQAGERQKLLLKERAELEAAREQIELVRIDKRLAEITEELKWMKRQDSVFDEPAVRARLLGCMPDQMKRVKDAYTLDMQQVLHQIKLNVSGRSNTTVTPMMREQLDTRLLELRAALEELDRIALTEPDWRPPFEELPARARSHLYKRSQTCAAPPTISPGAGPRPAPPGTTTPTRWRCTSPGTASTSVRSGNRSGAARRPGPHRRRYGRPSSKRRATAPPAGTRFSTPWSPSGWLRAV